jgi:major vault protein
LSEYAYMQDVTKGVIKTYTGPTVINPTAQERPVKFNPDSKRFEPCNLEDAVQVSPIAPEGYYLILKNPSVRGDHPSAGSVHPSPELDVGKKINITGPCNFALWPGQIVKLVSGHHLRSNQYLLVRVYNEEEAGRNWAKAVVKPAAGEGAAEPAPLATPPDLTVGKLYIIKGTDVSFYIPPTGVGVVQDEASKYVRDALTLERLEYCILVDQNGKKRYERGPQVVFPQPTESFIQRESHRKFRALELNEIQGLHIKVIAPYTEGGKSFKEGDELFITGKQTSIYFPREEHSLVRYDGKDKHFAVAVPAGEARYVMNRKTGEIRMARGPAMLLPNPTDEVIVRRTLSDKECETWYPGNTEVLAYNRSLRQVAAAAPTTRAGVVSEGDFERSQRRGGRPQAQGAMTMDQSSVSRDTAAMVGDVLERGSNFTQPRTIVINTKYEGVPTLNLWVGYAMMVVDRQGKRRVELGPKAALLEYDESLEILELSTGKPKSTEPLLRTVYLRVLNNKVSDVCEVETSDHVTVELKYSMRVNFTGEPTKWFEVENYVKFLCDHVRSVLKGTIKKVGIEPFYADAVDLVRDTILGKAGQGAARPGMLFPENGMHVTDVEVLGVEIGDPQIANLLSAAELETMQSHITLSRARRNLEVVREQEEIRRQDAEARSTTTAKLSELETRDVSAKLAVVLASVAAEMREHEERKAAIVARNAASDVGHHAELARRQATAEQALRVERESQVLRLEALRAEVEATVARFGAAQPGFSEALLAMSSQETLVRIADAMSVQSFVGGKTLTDVVDRVFAGTPVESLARRLAERAGANGETNGEARR